MSETQAKAVADEATKALRTLTLGEGGDAVTVEIPRKWKRFKFLRALNRGDIPTALEAIWQPTVTVVAGETVTTDHPSITLLEESDLTQEDFDSAMEQIAEALGGTSGGNSPASPT